MSHPSHRRAAHLRVIGLAACLLALPAAPRVSLGAPGGNVDLPRFPSISADGSSIVFAWRGDLWRVPSAGGSAVRLTAHPANETRSAWSSDGETIAFASDRDGFDNVYLMNADGTNIRRVTNLDTGAALSGFGTDGDGNAVITFDDNREYDIYRANRPYMIDLAGGDPQRLHDAFGSQPRVSPDGKRVLFARGGYFYGWSRRHGRGPETQDVWLYDRTNGSFKALTQWAGNDGHAKWADDQTVIYMSDREQRCVNLHRMDVAGGEASAKRLTDFTDNDVQWFDVSADGSTAVLHVWDTLYTLDLTDAGADPAAIAITANEDESDNYTIHSVDRDVSEAALSPDGQVMAYIAYGEVFVRNVDDKSPTRRVTHSHAREQSVAWSPDGLRLYFTSDRDGTDSIYAASVDLTRGEIKEQFTKIMNPEQAEEESDEDEPAGAAEPAEPSGDQPAPAAPADDGLSGTWSGMANIPEAGPMPFTMTLTLDASDNTVSGSLDSEGFSGAVSGSFNPSSGALSLVISASDGTSFNLEATVTGNALSGSATGEAMVVEVTADRTPPATPADVEQATGDAKKEAKKDLPPELDPARWHDAMRFTIEPVVVTEHNDRDVAPSPDGTKLAYRRNRGDVVVYDLESEEEHSLIESWDFGIEFRWSPDGRHIAYAVSDMDFNNDIFIAAADGSGKHHNVTQHPDNESSPRWSADGKILAFISERTNEENDVWMVYLDPDLEALTPKEMEEYYDDAVKAAKARKPLPTMPEEDEDEADETDDDDESSADDLNWRLDDAYLRLRRITRLPGGEGNLELTPGGDRYIFSGNDGGFGLFSVKWDGSDQKRLGGPMNVQHISLDGSRLVVIFGGRGGHVNPNGGSVEFVNIDHDIRIDLQQQADQKFHEMARGIGEMFYHPDMKGRDWEALTKKYAQIAHQTRTADEFNDVCNRMLGELTASHMGVRSTTGGYNAENRQAHGRLGARTERVANGFLVTDLIAESPAAMGPMALQVGDVITAIELEPLEGDRTLNIALEGRVGEETVVTVRRTIETEDGEEAQVDLDLLITPSSYFGLRQAAYDDWRNRTAKMVEELSDGRLGYIHIQGMNQPSLDTFERDLYAAAHDKDGLVIDVRNNGGGWTTDRLLSSIMVQPHAYTIPRGADPENTGHYPQDRLFIWRYSRPINMLCNEKSFSNAEIISHAFKNLKRGTLVGQETWGGVISTGAFFLIDGTSVRLPFRGWYVMDGTDMENHGAVPHIIVPQTPEAEAAGRDEQLEAAVEDLLQRLD